MKKLYRILTLLMALTCFSAYSINITINDGSGPGSGWYSPNYENQEVEPNCVTGQVWDMESFKLTGNTLVMTGGYNFTIPTGYGGYRPGDIFFDVNGGGYDYVAVIGNASSTYNVYSLGNTYDVYHAQNSLSNPWRYKDGGSALVVNENISYGSFNDVEGTHYTATLDLSWLDPVVSPGYTVKVHNTMECGNDNLLGQYVVGTTVPDKNNAIALFGISTLCIYTVKRKLKV